jgi:uncharacterized protein (TIGR03083 family)
MSDKAELYRSAQDRVVTLVRSLGDAELKATVPACPQWSVKDLVSHMIGAAQDFMTGNMAKAPGADWTQEQVDARADRDVDSVLDEWLAGADAFATTLAELPPGLSGIAVMDVVTHEHDLREALGERAPSEPAAVAFTLKGFVNALGRGIGEGGLPPVRVVATDGDERVAGDGEPAVTVGGTAYELMRSLSGRRTRAQVRELDWDGDPGPYLDVLSPFGPIAD